MSCSNMLPNSSACCYVPVSPTQEELRQYYGLPTAARNITALWPVPQEIRMPFGVIRKPGGRMLTWRIGSKEHESCLLDYLK